MHRWGIIWWVLRLTGLSEFDPTIGIAFAVDPNTNDLAWLGEGGWVFASDNLNVGLRTV